MFILTNSEKKKIAKAQKYLVEAQKLIDSVTISNKGFHYDGNNPSLVNRLTWVTNYITDVNNAFTLIS